MTMLFDVSGQLRTLVWSNNLLIRMKRLTSRTTRYVTTTSILPRLVRGKDNCGRALSNESVAKTTVAKRCPDESVANTTVLDRMVKYVAWHERSTSSLKKAQCRSARIQSNHTVRIQNYFTRRGFEPGTFRSCNKRPAKSTSVNMSIGEKTMII